MMKKNEIQIVLSADIFKKDFIDIEAKKGAGVKGEDMVNNIKLQYRDTYAYLCFVIANGLVFMCELDETRNTVIFTAGYKTE